MTSIKINLKECAPIQKVFVLVVSTHQTKEVHFILDPFRQASVQIAITSPDEATHYVGCSRNTRHL